MGDPCGVGPEVIVRALMSPAIWRVCSPVVVGSVGIMRRAAQFLGSSLEFIEYQNGEYPSEPGKVTVLDPTHAESVLSARAGVVDARGGQAAFDCLVNATNLCIQGQFDAIVTAPLNKEALHLAGHRWPGHTELLAHLCEVERFAMMLYLSPSENSRTNQRGGPAGLGMIHVTLHMAMREIFVNITTESVTEKIVLAHEMFLRLRRAMGLPQSPSIAVAALNPHGGENGIFGDEEISIIAPAVDAVRKREGIHVIGPLPVDTLMPRAVSGEFDAVVAMYHDQGHITLKLLEMYEALNITLGLPIIRVSVAHGTAFELAWRSEGSNTLRPNSNGMERAIQAAARLAFQGRSE